MLKGKRLRRTRMTYTEPVEDQVLAYHDIAKSLLAAILGRFRAIMTEVAGLIEDIAHVCMSVHYKRKRG